MTAPSRTLTTLAVGFLALDAVLLGYLGVALKRVLLVGGAVVCAASAAAVVGFSLERLGGASTLASALNFYVRYRTAQAGVSAEDAAHG